MQTPRDLLCTIKVTPLASESFGVRSMCTLVETPDVSVLLDGGVSLCPWRFSLPPHQIEFQSITRSRQKIAQAAQKASVATISHYHYDHHTPSFTDWVVNWTENAETARQIYQDKILLAKNPKENINPSQRERAWMFQKTGAKYAKSFEAADGKTYTFDDTQLVFSPSVAHGSDDLSLGWVIMTMVQHGDERFMFAPDVQGPMSMHTTELILAIKPVAIMLGGPPLYLAGSRVEQAQIDQGLRNLERIVEAVPLVILEHHALRDENWKQKMESVFKKAQSTAHCIVTAAEFTGQENTFLEAKRQKLFFDFPPSEEFKQWMKTLNNKQIAKPPI
jgi:predicted metallo-beta-lactamase superfamily hydrolase